MPLKTADTVNVADCKAQLVYRGQIRGLAKYGSKTALVQTALLNRMKKALRETQTLRARWL